MSDEYTIQMDTYKDKYMPWMKLQMEVLDVQLKNDLISRATYEKEVSVLMSKPNKKSIQVHARNFNYLYNQNAFFTGHELLTYFDK